MSTTDRFIDPLTPSLFFAASGGLHTNKQTTTPNCLSACLSDCGLGNKRLSAPRPLDVVVVTAVGLSFHLIFTLT